MSLLKITNLWPPFTPADLEVTQITAVGYYKRLPGIETDFRQTVGIENRYKKLVGPNLFPREVKADQ